MSLNISPHNFHQLSGDLEKKLHMIAEHILCDQSKVGSVVNLKFMTTQEMILLNQEFRKKNSDTNVLSFPINIDIEQLSDELGDIAISVPFVKTESHSLNRDLDDHMMHLLAHGILHLLGFDHEQENDANIMEAKEINYLEFFKITNPYLI